MSVGNSELRSLLLQDSSAMQKVERASCVKKLNLTVSQIVVRVGHRYIGRGR